jgi:hypothetical protein
MLWESEPCPRKAVGMASAEGHLYRLVGGDVEGADSCFKAGELVVRRVY